MLSFILSYFFLFSPLQHFNDFNVSNALIPVNEIKWGGVKVDGIPPIDNPKFLDAGKASYLQSQDMVLGLELNGQAKAYPIRIMNWHEIVNDQIGDLPVVITFCPLCGSGMAFSRVVAGQLKDFGVSGLLYNSDVLLYDRQTRSLWSQLMGKAISGKEKGKELQFYSLETSTWSDWKSRHPDTKVLSTDTGFPRDYSHTPYQEYVRSDRIMFGVSDYSDKFHAKEKVLGVNYKGVSKAYPFSELKKTGQEIISDRIEGKSINIKFNKEANTAFIQNDDIYALTLFWFAWYTFHPETKVYRYKE